MAVHELKAFKLLVDTISLCNRHSFWLYVFLSIQLCNHIVTGKGKRQFMMHASITILIINIGTLTLSPTTVAPVCRVGEQLLLTCSTTSASFLNWRFSLVREDGLVEQRSRFINRDDVSHQTSNSVVNSTTFTFMRVSTQGTSPFITTLLIDHVSSGLNGVVIECAEIDGTMETESTIIDIIGIVKSFVYSSVHYVKGRFTKLITM